ncbi:MAG: YqeG family HAD IIIA-type phosphatase [Firmicutes bacterium]|nr:YqeG family HAD IIIA-type phosphatase [Bacillota bacterium]
MFKFLYPKKYIKDITHLTPTLIKSLGKNTVIFDIDNTLVPYWVKTPDNKISAYFKELINNNITIAVLSNSREERSKVFCKEFNIPYVYRAGKPGTKGLKKLLKNIDKKPSECIIAGDQIFTDVWCGNKEGVYSVFVKKVSKKDELITAPKRPFENIILYFYFLMLEKKGKQHGK